MSDRRRALSAVVLAFAWVLALVAAAPVAAQTLVPYPNLPVRGAIQPNDQIGNWPANATNLQVNYARDLKAYVNVSIDYFGADPFGTNDSTSAINNALASGLPLTCSGTYKITSNLLVESPNNDGQTLRGGGSYYGAGGQSGFPPTATGACIIRPTSAVAGGVFVIDGTPFSGGGAGLSWVQGFGLENLTIDMTNMADVATNAAILQVQAWDGSYTRMRVIGDGVNKRAYLAKAGAYTSSLKDFQGRIVDLEGISNSNAVTTITLINPDIARMVINYANGIIVQGGSIQEVNQDAPAIYARHSGSLYFETDIESGPTATTYPVYDFTTNSNIGIWLQSGVSWNGPAYTVPLYGLSNFDGSAADITAPTAITRGYLALDNFGTGANGDVSTFFSGSLTHDQAFILGRTGNDVSWCVAGVVNHCMSGVQVGDAALYTLQSGANLWLGSAQIPGIKLTSTSAIIQAGISLAANQASFLSGSTATSEYVTFGRVNTAEGRICIPNATSACIFSGEAAGDFVIYTQGANSRFWIGAAGTAVRSYDGGGHEEVFGYPPPTAGTGTASVVGNDSLFVATTGSGVTSSTINFTTGSYAWATTPVCLVSGNVPTAFPAVTSVSTSAVTIGWSASVSGAAATVRCGLHN